MSEFGDISTARSIAVDLSKDPSGNDFLLGQNQSLSVVLHMKAPSVHPEVDLSGNQIYPSALNDAFMSGTLINTLTGEVLTNQLINWKHDTVSIHITADIPISKVDTSDPTKPVDSISFRLSGTSDYGNAVDTVIETGVDGYITFKDIEKGSYTLMEESGSPDYQRITNSFSVVVNEYGEVIINGEKLSEGKRYIIGDPPRVHADLSFTKKDYVQKNNVIEGVQFRLFGTSDYHNFINEYAFSDEHGVVEFKDIELGTYTLEEVSTVEGYIRNSEPMTVIIDENGNYSISGSYMEKDGSLTVYNDPLQSFTIMKESYTKTGGVYNPVPGAVFRLYGVSDFGTEVDMTKRTQSSGKAYFTGLEPGSSYIIEEISAPEGYIKDDTKRIVKILSDGTITISGIEKNSMGEFVFKNKDNSNVTVIKEWVDSETNATRTADPVIHIGIDNRDLDAYFGLGSNGSVLTKLTSEGNIKSFKPYRGDDIDYVKELISNKTAKKVDDGSTDRNIYAWYISDTNASDYGTVYWWSDAVTVYFHRSELYDPAQNLSYLWTNLTNITYIDVTGISVTKNTSLKSCFSGGMDLPNLKTIAGLNTWDVSSVTNMSSMFSGCNSLTNIGDISGWDVSSATSTRSMFYNCSNLRTLDLSEWIVSAVTDMECMFYNCSNLWSVGNLKDWRTPLLTSMSMMFENCSSLSSIGDVSNWNVSSVTNMDEVFYGCSRLQSVNMTNWDVSLVNTFFAMFSDCSMLSTVGDLSGWVTSSLSDRLALNSMFENCRNLRSVGDISGWDVSSVTSLSEMFYNCSSLNTLNLSGWDVSSVDSVYEMFYKCSSLTTLDLTGWILSDMINLTSLFDGCSNLKVLDLSGWDTSSVTRASYMFRNCSSLETIYAGSKWSMSGASSSDYQMFLNCTSIKGGNGTTYSSSNIRSSYARIDTPSTKGYLTQGTEPAPPISDQNAAYFDDEYDDYSTVLAKVTSTRNIYRFAPYTGDEEYVQTLISGGRAYRIDDGSTNYKIYAWYISSSSEPDYRTVYWWSDAEQVYLNDKAYYIWRGLNNIKATPHISKKYRIQKKNTRQISRV